MISRKEAQERVAIPCHPIKLHGLIGHAGPQAKGMVIFAHGSGSGRNSPRNMLVSQQLQNQGFTTLLFDLLTEEEEIIDLQTQHLRFDIPLLAKRLEAATQWVQKQEKLQHLPIGYFGASTGAGAALVAAARLGPDIRAVVSRGGRPDLAEKSLRLVQSPTLLIVGSLDKSVIELNVEARTHIRPGLARLEIVAGASHLFAEPGTLEKVAILAADWFLQHLAGVHYDSKSDRTHAGLFSTTS